MKGPKEILATLIEATPGATLTYDFISHQDTIALRGLVVFNGKPVIADIQRLVMPHREFVTMHDYDVVSMKMLKSITLIGVFFANKLVEENTGTPDEKRWKEATELVKSWLP